MLPTTNEKAHELAMRVPAKLPHAFDALALEIDDVLNRMLLKKVSNEDDLKDIKQLVLMRLDRDLLAGKYRDQTFYAWLKIIVRCTVYNFYDRVQRVFVAEEAVANAASEGTDDAVAKEMLLQRIEKEIEKLPAQRRRIVSLYKEGKEFAEIGEMMGQSAEAIRSAYCKAIESLQKALGVVRKTGLKRLVKKIFRSEDANRCVDLYLWV